MIANREPVAACELRPGDTFINLRRPGIRYQVNEVAALIHAGDTVRVKCAGNITWDFKRNEIVERVSD